MTAVEALLEDVHRGADILQHQLVENILSAAELVRAVVKICHCSKDWVFQQSEQYFVRIYNRYQGGDSDFCDMEVCLMLTMSNRWQGRFVAKNVPLAYFDFPGDLQ